MTGIGLVDMLNALFLLVAIWMIAKPAMFVTRGWSAPEGIRIAGILMGMISAANLIDLLIKNPWE